MKHSLPSWAKSYNFTGTLRPCLQSPRRFIPDYIRRPDYATNPDGISFSEQVDKANNTSIRLYTVSCLHLVVGVLSFLKEI